MSIFDYGQHREKAEHVMESLLSILAVPTCYTKFMAALPLRRKPFASRCRTSYPPDIHEPRYLFVVQQEV
jgi:hypothetical protein